MIWLELVAGGVADLAGVRSVSAPPVPVAAGGVADLAGVRFCFGSPVPVAWYAALGVPRFGAQ